MGQVSSGRSSRSSSSRSSSRSSSGDGGSAGRSSRRRCLCCYVTNSLWPCPPCPWWTYYKNKSPSARELRRRSRYHQILLPGPQPSLRAHQRDRIRLSTLRKQRPSHHERSPLVDIDQVVRLVLIGPCDAGKTCLLRRFLGGYYDTADEDDYTRTLGVDFGCKTVELADHRIRLQMWDTGGSETYRGVVSHYLRGADGVFMCFDVNRKASLKELATVWAPFLDKHIRSTCRVLLVGTKSEPGRKGEKNRKREVSTEQAKSFAHAMHAQIFETSAKRGTNVDVAMLALMREILHHREFGSPEGDGASVPKQEASARDPSLTAALAGMGLRDDSSEDGSSIGYFLPKDDRLASITISEVSELSDEHNSSSASGLGDKIDSARASSASLGVEFSREHAHKLEIHGTRRDTRNVSKHRVTGGATVVTRSPKADNELRENGGEEEEKVGRGGKHNGVHDDDDDDDDDDDYEKICALVDAAAKISKEKENGLGGTGDNVGWKWTASSSISSKADSGVSGVQHADNDGNAAGSSSGVGRRQGTGSMSTGGHGGTGGGGAGWRVGTGAWGEKRGRSSRSDGKRPVSGRAKMENMDSELLTPLAVSVDKGGRRDGDLGSCDRVSPGVGNSSDRIYGSGSFSVEGNV